MVVVGRGDEHGIDVLVHGIEHAAVVEKGLRPGTERQTFLAARANRASSTSAMATRVSSAAAMSDASPRPPEPITTVANLELGEADASSAGTGKAASPAIAPAAAAVRRSRVRRVIRPFMILPSLKYRKATVRSPATDGSTCTVCVRRTPIRSGHGLRSDSRDPYLAAVCHFFSSFFIPSPNASPIRK